MNDNMVRVFSDDIWVEFGLQKCAVLVMKLGKIEEGTNSMVILGVGKIKVIGKNSDY